MIWHIGNTTVRTPYRLKAALTALQGTQLNGNLHGNESENAFAELLNEHEVVNVQRLEENPDSDVSDLGRKWRSALSQLGFITHKVSEPLLTEASTGITGLSGRPFEITPNGYRLIQSEQTTAQQECFLRSQLAYRIPSVIEPRYDCSAFCPLKFVIDVYYSLISQGGLPHISFPEFALFVQTSTPENGVADVAQQIIAFRTRKASAEGRVRAFLREEYAAAVLRNDPATSEANVPTKAQTLDDYADLSLRYLKATGIFKNFGHGITLNNTKEGIAEIISNTNLVELSQVQYLQSLWSGADLPTDNPESAATIIRDLIRKITEMGGEVIPATPDLDVTLHRHILEEQLLQLEEMSYYRSQADQVDEISAWINALVNGGTASLPDGERIRIPKGEAPAYFEWVIWRAFLAINSLSNKPWEARRFQVDQDFLPINTAPGNGPDLIFEFQDAIVVVEVTLTSSSRQEAAEGEPVRRHVAKFVEEQGVDGKPVFGLFIAINIDSNTAHTFRTGDWYLRDDSKTNLHIVPLRLEDFGKLFDFGKDKLNRMPNIIQDVIRNCRMQANQDAPIWKRTISNIVEQTIR